MSPQEKSILKGEVRIILPGGLRGYDVYEKPIPQELQNHPDYGKYEWVGNFGLKDPSGNPVRGKVSSPYQVQVAKRAGKRNLVYWDGNAIVPLSGQDRKVGNRDFLEANLDLGDPPMAWG